MLLGTSAASLIPIPHPSCQRCTRNLNRLVTATPIGTCASAARTRLWEINHKMSEWTREHTCNCNSCRAGHPWLLLLVFSKILIEVWHRLVDGHRSLTLKTGIVLSRRTREPSIDNCRVCLADGTANWQSNAAAATLLSATASTAEQCSTYF